MIWSVAAPRSYRPRSSNETPGATAATLSSVSRSLASCCSATNTPAASTSASVTSSAKEKNNRDRRLCSPPASPRRRARLLGARCVSILDELVPNAPDGLNAQAAIAQLVAQPGDVNVDRPLIAGKIAAPVATEDKAGEAAEGGEQVELLGPELHHRRTDRRDALAEIEGQVAQMDLRRR